MAETPFSPESAAGEPASGEAPFPGRGEDRFNARGEGPFAASGDDDNNAADTAPAHGADTTEAATSDPAGDPAAEPTAEPTAEIGSDDAATTAPAESAAPQPGQAQPSLAAAAAAAPAPAAEPAGIATPIAVPPLETAARGEGDGGEWEMLVAKLNSWFSSGELANQWQKIRGPLKGVAILFGVLLALRLYATVVGTIDGIPLVSGLLELTGLIVLGQFGLTKMVKTSEREQVLANWHRRWQAFVGRD